MGVGKGVEIVVLTSSVCPLRQIDPKVLDSFPNIARLFQEFDIGADHNMMTYYFLICVSFKIESPKKITIIIIIRISDIAIPAT